ncbi:MAG: hypothetical protein FD131_2186 [Rhodocyclaceae bacterium]|nr:MAG: hypothetical protein FD131_2186 [Rhodocyclaceae bacterium]
MTIRQKKPLIQVPCCDLEESIVNNLSAPCLEQVREKL